jgi:hypothetical protein
MEYRQLDVGDTIEATDEADMCNDGWRDDPVWKVVGVACPQMVGRHPSDPRYPAHAIYRRPLNAESPAPAPNNARDDIPRCGVLASCPHFHGIGQPCTFKGSCSKRATSPVA